MSNPSTIDCSTQITKTTFLNRTFRVITRTLVVCFVCWHLIAILVRNPLDLWSDEIETWLQSDEEWWERWQPRYEKLSSGTRKYNRLVGCEQGWGMFSSPLARAAPYLSLEVEFADGSLEKLPTLTEIDPQRFLRMGGTRYRKLETSLYRRSAEKISDSEDLPVYAAYVRWSISYWHHQFPKDHRQPILIKLFKRRWNFPQPNESPQHITPGETDLLGTFDPEGNLQQ